MQVELFSSSEIDLDGNLELWLRFLSVPHFGAEKLKALAKAFNGDIKQVFEQDAAQLTLYGFSDSQIAALKKTQSNQLDKLHSWLNKSNDHFVITYDSALYPLYLKQISSAPLMLFGVGDKHVLSAHQLAIVGSRGPSEYGKRNATEFAKELTESGWVVTSGLAVGIDGFAHKGAISNAEGNSHTVAVLGSGVDSIYPKRHARLAKDIVVHGGAVISEFMLNTPPIAEHFPRRNRIVSGLAKGTLVIEAAIKSGSLITAYYALQQNRDVFAVPGNIKNPLSKGTHQLIKQGAKLVESVADILDEYPDLKLGKGFEKQKNLKKSAIECLATGGLLDSVEYDTTPVDLVAERSGLPVSVVLSELLEYELRGLVAAVPGGYIKLGD